MHWLPVEQCISYKLAVLTFNIWHTSAPSYLSRHITIHSTQWHSVTAVIGRSVSRCAVQTNWYRQRSFSCAAPATWNSLPPAVINCDTLSVFKSRLKTHLFNIVLPVLPAPLKLRQYGALQIYYYYCYCYYYYYYYYDYVEQGFCSLSRVKLETLLTFCSATQRCCRTQVCSVHVITRDVINICIEYYQCY